jgi:hypothetical protein
VVRGINIDAADDRLGTSANALPSLVYNDGKHWAVNDGGNWRTQMEIMQHCSVHQQSHLVCHGSRTGDEREHKTCRADCFGTGSRPFNYKLT